MSVDSSWPVNDRTVESTLVASRALLGVVARSVVEALSEVTLPQFRVMVLLSSSQNVRMGVLAGQMGAHPSTFSRTVDRLVSGGWVTRSINEDSRRETLLSLSESGRNLVEGVTARRREEIRRILANMDPQRQRQVEHALNDLAAAAGEPGAVDLLVLGV